MLNIYFRRNLDDGYDVDEDRIVHDVEREFKFIELEGSTLEKEVIHAIEGGKFLDSNYFIDRFGAKLHVRYMSTGCKAAMCVIHYPEKVIDLKECGYNAIDVIISLCNSGNILIREQNSEFCYKDDINVAVDNHKFNDIGDLNYYLAHRGLLTYEQLFGRSNN